MGTASATASRSITVVLLGLAVVACGRAAPPAPPPPPMVEVVRAAPIPFGAVDYIPPAASAPRETAEVIHEGTPEEVQARAAAALRARGFRILSDDRQDGLLTARYKGPASTYLECGTVIVSDAELGERTAPAVRERLVYGLEREDGARLVETRDYELQALVAIRFRHHAASLAPGTRVSGSADYALVDVNRMYRFDPARVDGLGPLVDASGGITRFTSTSAATLHPSRIRCVPSGDLEWAVLRG